HVAVVAAQSHMLIEVTHHAGAKVPSKHVRRRKGCEDGAVPFDLRADETEAADHIRPDAGTVRPADRYADDDVAHQIEHAVVAEVVVRPEETRIPPEVYFAADDPCAHSATADAEGRAAVVDIAAECRANPRRDESIRACLRWREHDRDASAQHQHLDD